MKKIILLIVGCGCLALLQAASTISGCVTDSSGKPVPGAKVFAEPVAGAAKTYRAEARKSDGCYEIRIGKDGTFRVGVRDLRFGDNGPIQGEVVVSGGSSQKVDLSTDIPNGKLLGELLIEGLLSASDGFSRVRSNRIQGGEVPAIMAQIPSGFGNCMLQFSNDQSGPTAMWWCSTGGGFGQIRDESEARSMFEKIRASIGTTLVGLGQLRYSSVKPDGYSCLNCVDRAIWASPINGVVSLNRIRVKDRNTLVLWTAYNSTMAEAGCSSIQKHEDSSVDIPKYDAAATSMRDEYIRQVNAAIKAEMGNFFGALVTGATGPTQQNGVTGESQVSPNGCLAGNAPPQPKRFEPIPVPLP